MSRSSPGMGLFSGVSAAVLEFWRPHRRSATGGLANRYESWLSGMTTNEVVLVGIGPEQVRLEPAEPFGCPNEPGHAPG